MSFSANPLFINTILLGGSSEEKLRAAALAGFDQVELWQQDVENAPGGAHALAGLCRALPLGLTDYQVLLDFDGAPDDLRDDKRREALTMMKTAQHLGATTLLVPASTHPHCCAERIDEDLRWLTRKAAEHDLRIAYEAMAWSRHVNNPAEAWRRVRQIDAANLGLVVDAFHLFVRQRTLADLAGIPAEKIFLVQLSDLDWQPDAHQLVDTARHQRLLPGEGHYPLRALLRYLQQIGYQGPLGLEVFNDARQAACPAQTADAAMASLRHLLQGG
ncbi:sugar phosphate isomerase/epimerase family protein [Erwinia persicina]|uniref:sugar phosphate isomerase/epimerase family protein n=1 Tax=Erwinia persicina TaxID=55211 RepID=UPI0017857E00|nr:sugar phosphate isomerase/epimerase family protein [Erwinia persicina]MBD8161311.1 sugar phosphate isomerase/epimerase [Erwinia persicina]